ncbi:TetR/AcrR family transcriptional regulator [Streptomyces sp. DH7]|uniref:TetR/AcrR family transcriptional regulator n=1 Tax=Streptomyces sp. DH7 TaxID=2857006 RepID=UPI001E2B5D4B|nr:TetR/AcrR family transcriptional regulator C-terminal domain-containing protein [Streptomyces sp. DH7]
MVVFAGQGDGRRSMALLWRAVGAGAARAIPGLKPGLSVDAIVAAGVEIADTEGMALLSMRAVGSRLGCTAMALYTYVPGKSELVDLMHDRVLAELPTEYAVTVGWRPAITAWADDTWAFYLRHPWVLRVSQARPILGPGEYAQLETVVRILGTTGLESSVLLRVIGSLFQFVRGTAGVAAEAREAAPVTGVSDEEWWITRSALLAEVAPDFARRFPGLAALEAGAARESCAADVSARDGGPDGGPGGGPGPGEAATPYLAAEARETFVVGLSLILDGIDTAVRRAAEARVSEEIIH